MAKLLEPEKHIVQEGACIDGKMPGEEVLLYDTDSIAVHTEAGRIGPAKAEKAEKSEKKK